jgi:hypothetical protein
MTANNVTNIAGRTKSGQFKKGVSGNPHGISAQERALRELKHHNDAIFGALMASGVPIAAKLLKQMLKNPKSLTPKEQLHAIELMFKYGVGTPRQASAGDTDTFVEPDIDGMDAETFDAMIAMLEKAKRDATVK